MYITETTDNVRKIFEELEKKSDISKIKFLLYIFGLLNNNQINNKNEANPELQDDDELIIFNLENIGFSDKTCDIFLQYIIMVYNGLIKKEELYVENGNILGIKYDYGEEQILSKFEKLLFEEKIDVYSEIIIRYDNDTYFHDKITMLTFSSEENGFNIASRIKDFKKQLIRKQKVES